MKIICRCQDVTEDEIIAAIRQGATTIDERLYKTQNPYAVRPAVNIIAQEDNAGIIRGLSQKLL